MYGWDTLVLLKHLLDEDFKKTDIARRLAVGREIGQHWIATGQLERELDDANGFVRYESEAALLSDSRLRIGKTVNVPGTIASHPDYRRFEDR